MPYRKDYKVFSPLPKNLDIPANNSKKYLDCKEDLQTRKILYAHPSKRSNLDKTEIITFSTITGLTTSLTLLTMGILNDFELGLLGIQHRCIHQEEGRYLQDGHGEQGVRSLSLVIHKC